MPLYHYEAKDRTGKAVIGSMVAGDEAVVVRRLTSMGYTLTSVQARPGTGTPDAAPERPGRVSSLTRALFLRQLATASKAGLPLYLSLTNISHTVADPSMAAVTRDLAARVERGGRLSDALAAHPQLFSAGAVGLVAAAELGGFLDRALADLADDAERQEQVRRELTRATRYLKFVIVAALFFGLPIASFIGPLLRVGLKTGDRAVAVAAGLRAALKTALVVSLPITAGVLAGGAVLGRVLGRAAWSRTRDAWLLKLPAIGRVHQFHARVSFLTTLARLTHAGVGPARSWETASGAVENEVLREHLRGALPMVEADGRLSSALAAARVCTPAEAGLVANGEMTGQVEESLQRVAENYHWHLAGALRQLPRAAQVLGYCVAVPLVLYVVARFFQSYFASVFQGVDDAFSS